MSLNGHTGLIIGLVILVSIVSIFAIAALFSYVNQTSMNKGLLQEIQLKNSQLEDANAKLEYAKNNATAESQNITKLLDQYEENKVTRSLKSAMDVYTDEDNLKDLCSLWGTKESNSNLTKIWQNTWDSECQVQPTPQPTPQPQPTPTPTPEPTPVPQPTCKADEVYNATVKECVAKPTPVPPTPTPQPTPSGAIKVAVIGDVDNTNAGTANYEQIKKQNPDMVVVLGDLGYDSNIDWFKKTYGTLGDKVWCIIGNHDADNEDGSAAIEKAAKEFCGNSYWVKKGVNLFMMLNTNDDDMKAVITGAGKVLSNQTIMQGVKSLHIMSHKPCAAPPNSHHPVEAEVKLICDAIKIKIPSGVKVFYDQAHNHVMSESADKTYKQSGAGGRSHYTCPTTPTSAWWCNNVNYGFLLYTIGLSDGSTSSQFIDYNGRIIH
jgi:outer membrane biosynthesis protein TonB